MKLLEFVITDILLYYNHTASPYYNLDTLIMRDLQPRSTFLQVLPRLIKTRSADPLGILASRIHH